MACFIVSAVAAAAVTAAEKAEEKKEMTPHIEHSNDVAVAETVKVPFSRKLKWYRNMLWGGVALLAFEHVWHGEVTPWAPFLTAAADPADTLEMLREMATVGVGMLALITVVWLGMCFVADAIVSRPAKDTL